MKIFVSLVVIVALIVAAVLYFGGGDLALTVPKKPSEATSQPPGTPPPDFGALTALLEKDMSNIPASLDAASVAPAHAFSVKSRLGDAAADRPEYQKLAQACDLIIFADQEYSTRRLSDQQAQQEVFTDLMAAADSREASITAKRTAIHAKAQADWDVYRRQTDAEVKRLLTSLPGAKR